jgi:hypothetical protein
VRLLITGTDPFSDFAIHHIMSRGDRREDVFLDDVDRQDFLKMLGIKDSHLSSRTTECRMTAKRFYDWQTAGGTDDAMRLAHINNSIENALDASAF